MMPFRSLLDLASVRERSDPAALKQVRKELDTILGAFRDDIPAGDRRFLEALEGLILLRREAKDD